MALWDKAIVEHLTPSKMKDPAVYAKFPEDKEVLSNKIEDHIKRYFQKDNLGHLSNTHLALTD